MKNHKLSGLPLDSAHIDGLSALFVHENLGIEMVMPAFVRYMAFVKDKIHPSKAYVDTTWLTENGSNWEWTNSRSPARVVFNMTLWKIESWVDEKIDKHLTQSWRLVSKQNVLGATAKREKKTKKQFYTSKQTHWWTWLSSSRRRWGSGKTPQVYPTFCTY